MRRHAKASTAGSTQRQAGSLGQIFRGALATREASSGAAGSGAPSQAPARSGAARGSLLAFALGALVLLAAAPAANASKATSFTFGSAGELGGQFNEPRGIAINETGNGGVPAGTLYVADGSGFNPRNERVDVFNATGSFLRAWGWDVVSAGPGNTGTGFEVCVAADGDTCKAGEQGGGGGQFAGTVTDVAVDQASGNVYVTDRDNRRVQEFSATGSFLRAWGWDVVSAGPGNTGTGFEVCVAADGDTCKAGTQGGGGGQFSWSEGLPGIDADSSGNVYVADSGNARLQKFTSTGTFLRAAGWDVVSGAAAGTGTLGSGSASVSSVVTTSRAFLVGQTITGTGIPAGTTITALGAGTITLSQAATASGGQVLSVAEGAGNVAVDEKQAVTVGGGAKGGSFQLTFTTPNPSPTTATTFPIPFGAPASGTGSVQQALEGLSNIGAGNVGVSGAKGGPYAVEFKGTRFADTDVAQISADASGLTPLGTVEVATTQKGSAAFEVCTAVADCKTGVSGASFSGLGPGQFTEYGPSYLAVDPAGDVYASDQNPPGRVLHFTPALSFDPGFSFEGEVQAVAVNPVDHHVFVSRGSEAVIHELNPATGAVLEEHFPGSAAWQGLAINPSSGRLYAVKGSARSVSVLEDVPSPAPLLDSPNPVTGITTEGATFHGTVNPNGVSTGYWFEYRADGSSTWTKVPSSEVGVGSGNIAVPVTQSVSGLAPPNTEYHLRLAAKNSYGVIARSAEATFTTLPIPPEGVTRAAAPRTDTTARLNGYVNPNHAATVYWFEFGPDDCSANPCASIPPGQDASAGAGTAPVLVAQEVAELQEGTTYHYCLVAENSAGTTPCEDRTFATRTAAEVTLPESCPNEDVRKSQHTDAYLPDCRGIELVNNPDKGNQNVLEGPVTVDGERALWLVTGGAPGGTSGAGSPFLAERAPDGWHSRNLMPPAAQQVEAANGGYGFIAATPDLGHFLFRPGTAGGSVGKSVVRLDTNQNQDFLKVYEDFVETRLFDMTDDGAHALYVSRDTEELEDIGGARVGPPEVPAEVVGLLPGGSLPECGVSAEGYSFAGPSPGAAGRQWRPGYHRIATTDASRVYFQVHPDGGSCGGAPWQLLVRNRETEETTEIASPSQNNALIRATPDGRSVFFVTDVAADPADANTHTDVYRWDEEPAPSGTYTCLTCNAENESGEEITDANLRTGNGGGLTAVMVSDDFSHVYFESESRLAPGATQGKGNLYALSGGAIRFIATPDDHVAGALAYAFGGEAELSADGNVLVFPTASTNMGNPELTADPFAVSCQQPTGGSGQCAELFRYDDRDRSLECLSCDHGGLTTNSFGTSSPGNSSFGLSADGETVAFETFEALTPLDVNDGVDLYEWRNGVQRLLTDGVTSFQTGLGEPRPVALSADGRDIFFKLVDPSLTGFEQDGFSNLYDARIGGGFIPPSPPVHCSEDSCQGPLQAAPAAAGAGSSTYSGRGNVPAARKPRRPCAHRRGKARKRCIRKHSRHSRKARAQINPRRAK